jgi:hypothetical protein
LRPGKQPIPAIATIHHTGESPEIEREEKNNNKKTEEKVIER